MKKMIKESVAGMFRLFSSAAPGLSILMYHSVGHNDKFSTVTPDAFAAQLRFLKRGRYTIAPLRTCIEQLERGESLTGQVALTFDDGYEDFYTEVFPLLQEHDVPATVFVITGSLGSYVTDRSGNTLKLMSEAHIREIAADRRVEVMPHTVTHPSLDGIAYQDAIAEMESSRAVVEHLTDEPADIFAYPRGVYTPQIAEYVNASPQWRAGVTVEAGLVHADTDRALLPRNTVDSSVGRHQFALSVSSGIIPFTRLRRHIRL